MQKFLCWGKTWEELPLPISQKNGTTNPPVKVRLKSSHQRPKAKGLSEKQFGIVYEDITPQIKETFGKKFKNLNFLACSKLRNQYLYQFSSKLKLQVVSLICVSVYPSFSVTIPQTTYYPIKVSPHQNITLSPYPLNHIIT